MALEGKKCLNEKMGCEGFVKERGNIYCSECIRKLKNKEHKSLTTPENSKSDLSSLTERLAEIHKKYMEEIKTHVSEKEILAKKIENMEFTIKKLELEKEKYEIMIKSLHEKLRLSQQTQDT